MIGPGGASTRRHRGRGVALVLLLALPAHTAQSHDPGALGGLFRSRDDGATWVSINRGPFQSGAIALSISPTDTNHLLLGAESGLFRSRNGGRDWTVEAPDVVRGAVFALAFAADGQQALASTGRALFRGESENAWHEVPAPEDAPPARTIVRGREAGRFYMAGWNGLYRSDDYGASWSNLARYAPREPATALLVLQGVPDALYAVVQGRIWASTDGGRSWPSRGTAGSPAKVDALAADMAHPARLWAAAGGQLLSSIDGGANWQPAGQKLPEPNAVVNGVAASEEAILTATDRGLYRSVNRGESWTLISDGLPAHLEAGPLLRDPADPASLYAGFALIPYTELWRRAAHRDRPLDRISLTDFFAGGVLLLLTVIIAAAALRWLRRYYPPSARPQWTAGARQQGTQR